jgi:hypothetical protein
MYLPTSSSSAARWALHDYRQRVISSAPAAGDVCQVEFEQVPLDELWLIERTVVQCTSTGATVAHLYQDVVDDLRVLDGTRVGNFDVADNASPLLLPSGSTLLVEWKGADDGAIGTALVQYVVLKRTEA